jgi:drug/metabolite transporter (DMT)-like permease
MEECLDIKSSTKTYIFLFLTIFIWSTAASTAKLLLIRLSNVQVLFYSTLFGSLTMFIVVVLTKKMPILFSYKFKDLLIFAFMSFFGIFLYYLFSFFSLQLIPTQIASSLNYLWPIFTIFLAFVFLGEKFSFMSIVAALISFSGVIVIVFRNGYSNMSNISILGILVKILSAVCYALFSVFTKKIQYDPITSLFCYLLMAFIFVCLLIPFGYQIFVPSLSETLGLIWFGSFITGLAYYFWIIG